MLGILENLKNIFIYLFIYLFLFLFLFIYFLKPLLTGLPELMSYGKWLLGQGGLYNNFLQI
jgi:hypothetical protein